MTLVLLCSLLVGSLSLGEDSHLQPVHGTPGFLAGNDAMRSFLRQHDFIYEKAPMDWYNGLPLGNGNLGAMVWGNGTPLTITLDSYELWDLRKKTTDPATYNYATMKKLLAAGDERKILETFGNNFRPRRCTIGGITQTRLTPGRGRRGNSTARRPAYRSRLDLHRARADGTITLERGSADYACFVDAVRGVILLDVQARDGATVKRINVRASKYTFPNLRYPKPEEGQSGDVFWRRQRQNRRPRVRRRLAEHRVRGQGSQHALLHELSPAAKTTPP